ncbi:GGDEF domain-containing protein [Conyzicola sp.]|uniref:GGDEF domain-containing protein n=1 Tax=Conyzicola sp. TaxID=1969404 RepID=UPI00398A0F23
MNLDTLTVLYASGLVVTAAGTSFVISSIFRRDDEVARLWGLGFISGMLATIAYAAWGYSPELWWITGIGNAALVFAMGAMWAGSRAYNAARPLLLVAMIVATIVFAAVVIHGPEGGEWAGAPVMYIAIAGFTAATAVETMRGQLRRRVYARILSVVFLAISAYYLARTVVYFVAGESSVAFLSYFGTVNTTLLNIGFLTVASISFSVLQSERIPDYAREKTSDRSTIAGVASRTLFEQQAQDWLRRAHRADDSLTLAIFEVENLDQMNIALGSEYGERAIQTVGWFTRDNVPTASIVGRLSPRRFAVITPSPAVGEPRDVAERVMTAIAENPIDEIEGVRALAAFGVATTADAGYDFADLARSAAAGLNQDV